MHEPVQEYRLTCPWCWEVYSLWLESEADKVELIEDCQVCCHPIQLRLRTALNGDISLEVERAV